MSDVYKFNPDEILSPDEEVIHDQNKTIERLKEQLKEAVDFIEELSDACDQEGILYPRQREKLEEIEKWGVK